MGPWHLGQILKALVVVGPEGGTAIYVEAAVAPGIGRTHTQKVTTLMKDVCLNMQSR